MSPPVATTTTDVLTEQAATDTPVEQAAAHVPVEQVVEESKKQAPPRRLSICIINPKFEPSYWGFDYALPLYPGNRRSRMITGALPALAGLAEGHDITLVDENVEDIQFEGLKAFDIVGVTGMIVQKKRMREILEKLREMKVFTVVGGAYASVNE